MNCQKSKPSWRAFALRTSVMRGMMTDLRSTPKRLPCFVLSHVLHGVLRAPHRPVVVPALRLLSPSEQREILLKDRVCTIYRGPRARSGTHVNVTRSAAPSTSRSVGFANA